MSNVPRNQDNLNQPICNETDDHNTITNNASEDMEFETSSQNIVDTLNMKVNHLNECLINDIQSCDFTWSLFQSALNSYRFDSCLRPYPPMFLKNGFKEPTKMKHLSELVPNMNLLRDTVLDKSYPENLVDLLHWVLVEQREPYIKICEKNNEADVSVLYNYISPKQLPCIPDYICEIVYTQHQEEQWQNRKLEKKESIFAFHGSRLDNFYSILKFGLQQHMSATETLFGAGIYLTSELMLSLTYSPSGTAWKKSMFGSVYSIVALCEIINDTEKVKCQDVTHKRRCVNVGSIGGYVPDKYYIVLNSDFVRVRYLLLFKQSENRSKIVRRSVWFSWFRRNKMTILLVLYTMLLLTIGFFNSQTWRRYRRIINKYFSDSF